MSPQPRRDDDRTTKGEQPTEPEVASAEANAELEHSEGGATTRNDTLDVGVPMLQGSPDEPVGPEDALGRGLKRGNYVSRQDGSPHVEMVPNPRAGEPIYQNAKGKVVDADAEGATIVDFEPAFVAEDQGARVEEIGDAEGLKGGVDTDLDRGVGAHAAGTPAARQAEQRQREAARS